VEEAAILDDDRELHAYILGSRNDQPRRSTSMIRAM